MPAALAPVRHVSAILIRPMRGGWQCFECRGVEPVFHERRSAIEYARQRSGGRHLDILIHDADGKLETTEHLRPESLTLYTGSVSKNESANSASPVSSKETSAQLEASAILFSV